MQGLSLQSLKKHKALIPLYICTALGCGGAIVYLTRLALRSPDVSWNKKTNPEPWEEYRAKQYKFYSPVRDYSKEESPAPKY
ncbi:cytochrome c oxidase subunit NDUFA4 [Galleria mellonella]|uniref:Cytochrome c oxidase subunit NDUFA4 n=1 Tax=Galleria mellonella TaxID=7137 RepID=A0A6J1X1Y8_GALME|nr:cytochrome c oxidase subunit NDUFA4 [Galleria mellonella]